VKLHNTGVFTSVLTWLESYFTQRNQFVGIEDATSDILPVNFGVFQGSILGPVLFTVHANDLLLVPRHCKSSGYVDNTNVFLSPPPRDITDACVVLHQDLLEISRWWCVNSLSLILQIQNFWSSVLLNSCVICYVRLSLFLVRR